MLASIAERERFRAKLNNIRRDITTDAPAVPFPPNRSEGQVFDLLVDYFLTVLDIQSFLRGLSYPAALQVIPTILNQLSFIN